jgi:hypothetical protein
VVPLEKQILKVLDDCCGASTFPMLDNGYVYPAASRLTIFRSDLDWAIVIETFGFSPRSVLPDINVSTFASRLYNRKSRENYVSEVAYDAYLKNNPNNESSFYFPIEDGPWQDEENGELVAVDAQDVSLRGNTIPIPRHEAFEKLGIALESSQRIKVFELCRVLAAIHRELVLATPDERMANVLPGLPHIMELDDWNHPDLADGVTARDSEAFQQLAKVIATGDRSQYRPSQPGNTHWRNWPGGGQL